MSPECEYRPIERNGRSGGRFCASQIASFWRTKQGSVILPRPANVRKHDDLHQSGYPNYQLHYLGSGLHFSCPNPKRAADGSSSRRLFEKNGLRLFCAVFCGVGIMPDAFRLPSYGFPTWSFAQAFPFFPSNVRLQGRSSTTHVAPPTGNAAGKERQSK